jgi:hypothetical protein
MLEPKKVKTAKIVATKSNAASKRTKKATV